MPRIRKKTSNRIATRDREKVKKKVRDSKKKKAKEAKKNPQWKSKKPKDPGIPNDFPYKDQILAEVQEERRIAAEEKRKVKEEKQKALARAKAMARGEIVEDEAPGSDGLEGNEDLVVVGAVDADGIAGLSAKAIDVQLMPRRQLSVEKEEEEEEEEEVPVLINRDLPNLLSVLDKADVVLEVLDARDPLEFRSKHVEGIASEKGKRIVFVLNKIDRCPREAVTAWTVHLRAEQPTLLFRSASAFLPEERISQALPQGKKGKGKAKVPVDDGFGADSILSFLAEWAKEKGGDSPFTVAVVGLANVGKSSLINSLLKKKSSSLPVYSLASSSQGPTTTELPQEVSLNANGVTITFIDTPGFSFTAGEGDASTLEQNRAKDILLRSKGRIDRLKDPSMPISHIVSKANNEDLMLLYSLPAFMKGDSTAFLSAVTRANQMVKRKGDLDLTAAARLVLRDWNSGKFARYTTPPTPPPTNPASSACSTILTRIYAKDETILNSLGTRKEMRKKGGLVKLSPSFVETRQATVEEIWAALADGEEVDGDGDGDDDGDGDESEDDGIHGDDEDEDNEEEEEESSQEQEASQDSNQEEEAVPSVVPLSRRRKRKREPERTAPNTRPAKKVVTLGSVAFKNSGKNNDPIPQMEKRPKDQVRKGILKQTSGAGIVKGPHLKREGKAANAKPIVKDVQVAASQMEGVREAEGYDFGEFF